MITLKEYHARTDKDWQGTKVRNIEEMQNGSLIIPAGTVMEIERKYAGFTLRGRNMCTHCGFGQPIYITRVNATSLELVDHE